MAKRGKWSGAKELFRRRGSLETVVLPAGTRPPGAGPWDALLKPLTKGGRIVLGSASAAYHPRLRPGAARAGVPR